MPRHADYGGHKSRPGGNERDFNDDYHWSDKQAMKPNDWLTTNTVSFLYAHFLGNPLAKPINKTPFIAINQPASHLWASPREGAGEAFSGVEVSDSDIPKIFRATKGM